MINPSQTSDNSQQEVGQQVDERRQQHNNKFTDTLAWKRSQKTHSNNSRSPERGYSQKNAITDEHVWCKQNKRHPTREMSRESRSV